MGPGQTFLTQVGSGQFFVAWVESLPFMVWSGQLERQWDRFGVVSVDCAKRPYLLSHLAACHSKQAGVTVLIPAFTFPPI